MRRRRSGDAEACVLSQLGLGQDGRQRVPARLGLASSAVAAQVADALLVRVHVLNVGGQSDPRERALLETAAERLDGRLHATYMLGFISILCLDLDGASARRRVQGHGSVQFPLVQFPGVRVVQLLQVGRD